MTSEDTAYLARELTALTRAALRTMPVVVVTGLRQAGKTTFLQRDPAFADHRYLTLDDYAALGAAQRDPEALLGGTQPLVIDEIQRCPELLPAVKRAVDRRRRPGRFVLSGSANLHLLAGVSESLAGRALYLTLHPFTRRERLGRTSDAPFLVRWLDGGTLPAPPAAEPERIDEDELLRGGLPPLALGETERRDLWLLGYEQTYLERDVRSLAQVADLVAFRNLLRLAALRTAQVLNQSELARDAKLPVATLARHLGVLETSLVLSRLSPHRRSRASRLIKSPKLFVTDSGLAGHLTGVRDLRPTADEPLRGALFETYVLQNLAGILGAHRERAELGFWSVQGRHEVDFVVSLGRRVIGIEVKAASRFGSGDVAGLRAFLQSTPGAAAGILAYNGSETVPLGERLYAVPLATLLS
jgi:hypothetical protein